MLTVQNGIPKHVIDAMTGGNLFNAFAVDGVAMDAYAFLQAELEKRDPKIREPLTSVTWMRDIVAKTGGGWVDFTSVVNVDYATPGASGLGIIGGQTTAIPVMQANLNQDVYRVYNWGNILKVPYIDMKKMNTIGRSLDDLLDKGITLNWNKTLDSIVYTGFGIDLGLMNQTAITAVLAAVGAGGLRTWASKTSTEILNDFNTILNDCWAASQYDVSGIPNHILVPPVQFGMLTAPMTIGGYSSILEYVLKNNVAYQQGVNIQVLPSRWCIGAGAGGTDRMLAYVNDEDKVYFDIPVPINRAMTMPSVLDAGYLTLYLGQIGVVKFLYTQPAEYMDGI
jgi:hypothetical protein